MRKAHLLAEISRLKDRETQLTRERDGLLGELQKGADSLRTEVAGLRTDIGGLAGKVTGHGTALSKHGDDIAGLADAVRASLLARTPEDKPAEAAPEPTPITAKRGTKAAG